jgi:hypothetical protein
MWSVCMCVGVWGETGSSLGSVHDNYIVFTTIKTLYFPCDLKVSVEEWRLLVCYAVLLCKYRRFGGS